MELKMNQKIRSIWGQAIEIANKIVPTDIGKDYFLIHDRVVREKFAELLVKECADAADMAHKENCPYVGDFVGEHMGYGEKEGIANWRAVK